MNISEQEFDSVFPFDVRQERISSSSFDSLGNNVVCYRYVNRSVDKILSEESWWTRLTHTWEYSRVRFLKRFLRYCLSDKQAIDYWLFHAGLSESSADEILREILNSDYSVKEDIDDILSSRACLVDFIIKYIPELDLMERHRFSSWIEFSPYFSWSIWGYTGLFSKNIWIWESQSVYVEAVIPEQDMIYDDRQKGNEKEILTKKIKKEWITRVFFDPSKLAEEVFHPDSNIWVKNYFETGGNSIDDLIWRNPIESLSDARWIVDDWRFNTDTKLYLPKDMKIKNI